MFAILHYSIQLHILIGACPKKKKKLIGEIVQLMKHSMFLFFVFYRSALASCHCGLLQVHNFENDSIQALK